MTRAPAGRCYHCERPTLNEMVMLCADCCPYKNKKKRGGKLCGLCRTSHGAKEKPNGTEKPARIRGK